jgi:membrane-associated phospholipid phosphatase
VKTALRLALLPAALAFAIPPVHASPAIPHALAPAADATLAMVSPARGVQVYECRAKGGGYEWAFIAPDAELFDERGALIGRHGVGPVWEAADGSRVRGAVSAKADAPVSGTIPWLLLATRTEGREGRLSGVTQIQRVNTTGGATPSAGCSQETVGQQARVPYTADYRLYAAKADPVVEWNRRAGHILGEARLGTPPAVRAMAMVQTAVAEAATDASHEGMEAAIAAANRAMLAKLVPSQQALVDHTYHAVLAKLPESPARAAGIAAGEKAAARVLASRADDNTTARDEYRPDAGAGRYVPTVTPAAPHWSRRKPWLMQDAAQFRPAAPPPLGSDAWARDFNEVKVLGARDSHARSEDQTRIARFWEYSQPPIYFGVVRSVAAMPGRDAVRNAKLYAAVAQAMDDALISVFDAKYHYHFWRPSTAIRNGDYDGNRATQRDPSWTPLIDAPLHPEFPSGHAILAGAVGAVLKADVGPGAMPVLATASPTLQHAVRQWNDVDAFVREVADSRIYAGIHYRSAVDAGADTGRRIGELAAARHLQRLRLGDAR